MIIENKNKNTKLELDSKRGSLQNALDQVDGFIFQFTYDSKTDSCSFPFVSGGLQTIYGFSAYDLEKDGSIAFEDVHDEDRPLMWELIFKSRDELIPWKQDYRLNTKERGVRWLRGNAVPKKLGNGVTMWSGYISDISEIKEVELELHKSRERYEFALEGSKMGYWDWDIEDKTSLFSDRSLDIIGVKKENLLPQEGAWTNLVHPDDKEKYLKDIQDHLNGLTSHYSNQHRILTSNGSYKWIHDRGKTVAWDSKGNPSRVIGTHVDITKLKEDENTILENNNLIKKHNDRLQNFALIVSHNLRNHAGTLVEVLRLFEDAQTPEERKELSLYLSHISTGLSNTINNLDDIVSNRKKLGDVPKKAYIREYVEKVISIVKKKAVEKGVTIKNEVSADAQIMYNIAYLESILYNLISNAIKYSDPLKESYVHIALEGSNTERMSLSVTDNGLGIDLDTFGTKLFGMYKTFHRNNDAQGLGLFMTKNQIDDMGDHISVKSIKDIGSTFTVDFKNKLV